MIFNPLEWFRADTTGTRREPLKKLAAGLVVWVLAGMVVWWNQDARASVSASQQSAMSVVSESSNNPNDAPKKVKELFSIGQTSKSLLSWVGTLVGLGLFWGGGVLVLRPLSAWGLFQPWLLRCGTVERLALVTAAALTLLTIVVHWVSSNVQAWMLAALIGLLVLASAFGWKLPGAKQP